MLETFYPKNNYFIKFCHLWHKVTRRSFPVLCMFFGSLIIYLGTLVAANKLHRQMMGRILRCPMSFYETTPKGRILSRFAKDIDVCDLTLPQNMKMWPNVVFRVCCITQRGVCSLRAIEYFAFKYIKYDEGHVSFLFIQNVGQSLILC